MVAATSAASAAAVTITTIAAVMIITLAMVAPSLSGPQRHRSTIPASAASSLCSTSLSLWPASSVSVHHVTASEYIDGCQCPPGSYTTNTLVPMVTIATSAFQDIHRHSTGFSASISDSLEHIQWTASCVLLALYWLLRSVSQMSFFLITNCRS